MESIEIKVNAKINLSLDVTGVRADGYHTLDMLMASVDIFDGISAKKSATSSATMDGRQVGDDNTAVKALRLLKDRFDIAMQVDIVKGIPLAAGLGGSSADASGVFFCASKLYDIPLEKVTPLALEVGCDVPYMIKGGGARVSGVGEVIVPVEIPPMTLVIAQKVIGASTKDIYLKYDEMRGERGKDECLSNALERGAVALTPLIVKAREDLQRFTDKVFMTGSGSAYVGVFDDEKQAINCAAQLKDYVFASVAHTKSNGIEINKKAL